MVTEPLVFKKRPVGNATVYQHRICHKSGVDPVKADLQLVANATVRYSPRVGVGSRPTFFSNTKGVRV
jgi:hypothetical protein